VADKSDLVRRATGGDREALGALLARHQDAAYALALALTGEGTDAEDACQDAFVRALLGVRAYAPERGSFRAWLLSIVRAAALDLVRSRRSRRAREEKRAMERTREGASAPELRERAGAVHSALMALEAKYRLPVMLHYMEGLTQAEVAAVLGAPEGTVASSIARGREKLRTALRRGGYAAAPGALGALLAGAPRPAAPAAVRAVVKKIATGRFAPGGQGRSVARAGRRTGAAAGKGGVVMKLVAGVVLAGAVAAGVAMVAPGDSGAPLPGPSAGPTGGPPKKELFAFVNQYEYLDGPRLEAMTGRAPKISWDEKGNLYFFPSYWYGAIRCIRTDGRIVPITGNDYWTLTLPLEEGPASTLGNPTGIRGFSYGIGTGCLAVQGAPIEGEEAGCVYVSHVHDGVVRVFRNKAKENRWWFERVAGGGKGGIPSKRGQSVAAKDVKLGQVGNLQVGRDGKLWIFVKGTFLQYENGKLTCLLGIEDYGAKGPKRKGQPEAPAQGYIDGDGFFYMGTYFSGSGYGGKAPAIWRVSPDGAKVEPLAHSHGSTRDGDAMKEAAWHCGPHFNFGRNDGRYQPPGILFTSCHDEAALRRIMGGRVSTLCKDGEWREIKGKGKKEAYVWFQTWQPGPDGASYEVDSGGDWRNDCRLYRITNIDYAKPTVK